MKNFAWISVAIAAVTLFPGCNKDKHSTVTSVTFATIADLDTDKTTWIIQGSEVTLEQWNAMQNKL